MLDTSCLLTMDEVYPYMEMVDYMEERYDFPDTIDKRRIIFIFFKLYKNRDETDMSLGSSREVAIINSLIIIDLLNHGLTLDQTNFLKKDLEGSDGSGGTK